MAYGPIELLVLEHDGMDLPAGTVTALGELTESGLVRIVDIALVIRDPGGAVHRLEMYEIGQAEIGGLDPIVDEIATLVSADDLAVVGEAVSPGRSALVVVIEHRWPGRLEAAVRESGGTLALHLRIPREAVDEVVTAHTAATA